MIAGFEEKDSEFGTRSDRIRTIASPVPVSAAVTVNDALATVEPAGMQTK